MARKKKKSAQLDAATVSGRSGLPAESKHQKKKEEEEEEKKKWSEERLHGRGCGCVCVGKKEK